MVVHAQSKGHGNAALYIGQSNVRRFFPHRIPAIELRLGELQIRCTLPATFWQDNPEIYDPRLGEWLKFHVFHQRPRHKPQPLYLVDMGKNAFRLQASQPAPTGEDLCDSRSSAGVAMLSNPAAHADDRAPNRSLPRPKL